MSIFEAGVRGGAIALMLLLAGLFWRDARGLPGGRYAALFVACAACDLVGGAPVFDAVRPLWLVPFRLLASGTAAVFWLSVTALFDEDFEAGWRHLAVWLTLMGLGVFGAWAPVAWRALPHHGLALICIGLAVWVVLAGRSNDLDEGRRRLRLMFVATVGPFAAVSMSLDLLGQAGHGSSIVSYARSIGNLLLAAFFCVALTSLTPGALLRPLALARARPPRAPAEPVADDPRAGPLLDALRRELETNRAYREPDLGIAALAARLGAPEYRLRQLINQRLGHRNFAAFLNGYRLEETMAALADPGQVEVPILTIALDAGFASIGPFNRAFKARTGQTPTEFRRAALISKSG